MEKVKVSVEGVAPLLMNRFNTEETAKTGRAKKIYVPEEEAEKKTYRTKNGKLYLPNLHFKASMTKAATEFKMKGKKSYKDYIKAGIFISPEEIILDKQEYSIFATPVVIQRARVMSWRPQFKEWSCNFVIEIADENLAPSVVKEILEFAGKYKGVGDFRPEHGRFQIKEFKTLK